MDRRLKHRIKKQFNLTVITQQDEQAISILRGNKRLAFDMIYKVSLLESQRERFLSFLQSNEEGFAEWQQFCLKTKGRYLTFLGKHEIDARDKVCLYILNHTKGFAFDCIKHALEFDL